MNTLFAILILGPTMLLMLSAMAVILTGMLIVIFGTLLNGVFGNVHNKS